jgi:hypothetical protein
MPVTLQLANQVLKLRRQNMTVGLMAAELGRTEAEILETHRMLGIGIAGEIVDQQTSPTDEARAALRERIPKKWRGHYGKAES